MNSLITLEEKKLNEVLRDHRNGEPSVKGKRLGQAVYDYFKMEKMNDQTIASKLYNVEDEKFKLFVQKHFLLT